MLLGNVAMRSGERFTYDFRTGKTNIGCWYSSAGTSAKLRECAFNSRT